ncbi:hypothetical protein PV797_07730 [Clostridiaceae bacterium M8S5]|nr:hypothetical protein PV797_07730 [Clostridiaceae bacterium M8S5]
MVRQKTKLLLEEFIGKLPESHSNLFMEIAQYAISKGYTPKRTKSKNFTLDYSKSKVKKTILRMVLNDDTIDENIPGIRLKFYASRTYSDIFKKGVQTVIEEFDGKYTGCYGCGRCKGELEGYTYVYEDGKKVFRCGSELIPIRHISKDNVEEIKALINNQDKFFMSRLEDN